jgi:hypothetical protein
MATYELWVTYTSGYTDIGTCDTFADLSAACDAARGRSGFKSYRVRTVGGEA